MQGASMHLERLAAGLMTLPKLGSDARRQTRKPINSQILMKGAAKGMAGGAATIAMRARGRVCVWKDDVNRKE